MMDLFKRVFETASQGWAPTVRLILIIAAVAAGAVVLETFGLHLVS